MIKDKKLSNLDKRWPFQVQLVQRCFYHFPLLEEVTIDFFEPSQRRPVVSDLLGFGHLWVLPMLDRVFPLKFVFLHLKIQSKQNNFIDIRT